MGKNKFTFYAVARGRKVGLFSTWDECKTHVNNFNGAKYRGFHSKEDAQRFIETNATLSSASVSIPKSTFSNRTIPGKRSFGELEKRNINEHYFEPDTNTNVKQPVTNLRCELNSITKAIEGMKLSCLSSLTYDKLPNQEVSAIHEELEDLKKEMLKFAISKGEAIHRLDEKLTKHEVRYLTKEDTESTINKRHKSTTNSIQVRSMSTYKANEMIDNEHIDLARQNGFDIDEEGFVEVYTDGACTNNGQVGAKAGIGVFWSDKSGTPANLLNVAEPVTGSRATNNVGEIQAITRAIQQAIDEGITKLRVLSDSNFAIQCVEEWMPRWKVNGWKTAKGDDVVNRSDLEVLDMCLQKARERKMTVEFKHVRGHMGNSGNEAADKLAVEGASRFYFVNL